MSAWRAFLFAACAIATIGATAELFCVTGFGAPAWLGIKGLTEAASRQPYVERISSVNANTGASAERAGVRGGDLVDVRDLSPIERFGIIGQPLSNRPLTLVLRRDSRHFSATIVPLPDAGWRAFPPDYLEALAAIWLSIFAWLLAIRKSDAAEVRLLALTLASSALWLVTDLRNVAVPWTAGYVAIALVYALTGPIAVALWATFASQFSQPISPLRRALLATCYVLGVIDALVRIGYPLGVLTLWVDPVRIALAPLWSVPHLAQVLAALSCGLAAVAVSWGDQRRRAAWSIFGVALIFCVQPFTQYAQDVSTSYAEFNAFEFVQAGAVLLAPIGLTYAMLSRRMFDTGFVMNRAAVFSGVSIVLLGTFVLVEWLLADWLRGASHTTNLAVTGALALVLGISIRAVHARVDGVVDAVFFRKRHEDEQAIRKLAREAPFVTDAKTLLERTVATLERHAAASTVAVLLDDGDGHYGGYGENDPALVELRAFHEPLDLKSAQTVIPGEFAYPMAARGRLIGALVVGAKTTGEAYAPDESDAIAQLAHAVGIALDALAIKSDGSREAVLDAVLLRLQMISQKLDAMNVTDERSGETA